MFRDCLRVHVHVSVGAGVSGRRGSPPSPYAQVGEETLNLVPLLPDSHDSDGVTVGGWGHRWGQNEAGNWDQSGWVGLGLAGQSWKNEGWG